MGLSHTKHVYVDRDMTPKMFNLLCLAEAVSPLMVWMLVTVGVITVSRWVLEACRRIRLYVIPSHSSRSRVPMITWPLPPREIRRRASDPGLNARQRECLEEELSDNSTAPLSGLVRMLREGLRNRRGTWARWQWR